MTEFFNTTPDFTAFTFSKPLKGSDNRYFIACHKKMEDSAAGEILCQLSKQIMTSSEFCTNGGTSFFIADENAIEFIKECDEQFLNICKENKAMWFPGKEITDAYVEQAHMPSLKEVKKQKNTYELKTRVSKDFVLFDNAKEQTDIVPAQNTKMSVILQIAGLWFSASRFGITWKLRQGKLRQEAVVTKLGESLFDDENEEEDDDLDNVFPDE